MHEVEFTASAVNVTALVTLRSVAWLRNAGNGCATPIYRRHAAGSGCTHAPSWRQCMVPDGHKSRTSHACAGGQQLGLGAWLPHGSAPRSRVTQQ